MSDWLKMHKKKFDDAAADKLKREQEEIEASKSRQKSAYSELTRFIENALNDLVGKKTKDGKKLRLELDNERHYATMYAGDEKFLYLHFWYKEDEDCDGDGCSWGNGHYYIKKDVIYHRPHKSKDGYDYEAGKWKDLYDEDLAHYLLTFVEA